MSYTREDIKKIVNRQREYFLTNVTFDLSFRKEKLLALKETIIKYEKEIEDALYDDLGRSEVESYLCDIGPSIMEINENIKNLKKWSKPEKHFSGITLFPSISTKVYKVPYGVCLIISPYNFPFFLTFSVLAASIAAGNTAVIKASSKSSNCTKVLSKIISETFDEKYVKLVDGGHDVADFCLGEKFDKIFYTGSPDVGKHVLEMASNNLIPVTLELGGETGNYCIVRKDADLRDAARKVAFAKVLNSGQICININQVAVAKEVASEFIELLKKEFVKQIGKDAVKSDEYPKLINSKSYDKCDMEAKMYSDRILYGGYGNRDELKYSPTIIYPVDIHEEIVNHELFSPLLPIIPFDDEKIDELLLEIQKREHPLALYIFTKDIKWANDTMSTMQYGGGCINDVIVHSTVKGVPFNGTGHSGMGAYHGKWGFEEFSHLSTVLVGKSKFNLKLREHPYKGKIGHKKLNMLRKFEK